MGFLSDLGGSLFGGAGTDAAGSMGGMAGALAGSANALRRDYTENFRELVNGIPGKADIPLSQYANEAAGDVAAAFDRQRGMAQRQLGRMGVNPNSGRSQALAEQLDRAEAAARSGAMTSARSRGRLENWGRENQAAGLGLQMMGMGNSALANAAQLTGSAGYLGMAGQDQQYGRLNDLAEVATLGMWNGGQSVGMNQSGGGSGGGGGATAGQGGFFAQLFPWLAA